MKKTEWLNVKISPEKFEKMKIFLEDSSINTVCESADCPNIGECFSKKTATFMIMGNICTRGCRYCSVPKGKPYPLDKDEPKKIANAVEKLGLKYVVITSVTRDDVEDGGAIHFANTIKEIKKLSENIKVEILVSDFLGNEKAIKTVIDSNPDVCGHNIETIPRLYKKIRPKADYKRSLNILKKAKEINKSLITKSGIMVGLGESEKEVIEVMHNLRDVDCDIMTIGQYLRPSKKHVEVAEYIKPQQFKKYEEMAYIMGFKYVASQPLVRSSYHAEEAYFELKKKEG